MTEPKPFNVFGVGNALLDILALVEDNFIQTHDLNRGAMTLMDTIKQGKLLQQLESHALELRCGGSAANTMIAIAQSGGTGIYSGKVSMDTNGEFYQQDMVAAGIGFEIEPADSSQGPTGTCLVLTTPDAERTMCTNLGVSTTDLEVCARQLGEKVNSVFITNSDKGCLVVENQSLIHVPGFPVKPVDTVGAGDAFAGGVLYGLTNGLTTTQAARWGNYLGSQIVQIHGPRLPESQQQKLKEIIN